MSLTNSYCVKLNDLCRVCGKSSDVKFDIFGPEGRKRQLVDKIHKHLPIAVTKNDKLPLQVCNVCAMHLDICHQLVQCCEQAEKNLNLMISKDTTSEKTIETGLECLNHPELVASVSDSSAINTPRPKASSNVNTNKVVSKVNQMNFSKFMKFLQASEKCIKVLVVRLKGSENESKSNQHQEA